jgi:hypothetical protein
MQPTPHCHRCGYANAPSWARCCCCGRPIGDHHLPKGARVLRASARRRPRRAHARTRTKTRTSLGLETLVVPAASLTAIAGAWIGPVTPDQRAGLLTAAAAASTYAALQPRSRRRQRVAIPAAPVFRGERIDDLAAVIAAW